MRVSILYGVIVLALFSMRALGDNAELAAIAPPPPASPEAASDTQGSIVVEVPAPPVVIEGEGPPPPPTLDELMQRFRESLTSPPSFLSSERRLADGTIEARTRLGRFCGPPMPPQVGAGIGGDIRLIAPCASF